LHSKRALQDHERQVAEFMAQAEAENPEHYREVTERYAVLTDRQLQNRRSKQPSLDAMLEQGYQIDTEGNVYEPYQEEG
jgi:uncharacterized protein involved in exopolysaccharide biosynthesis